MTYAFDGCHDIESEALDISAMELADLLDSGLLPAQIDRLCFTRWRLRSGQLQGDGWPPADAPANGETPRYAPTVGHDERL